MKWNTTVVRACKFTAVFFLQNLNDTLLNSHNRNTRKFNELVKVLDLIFEIEEEVSKTIWTNLMKNLFCFKNSAQTMTVGQNIGILWTYMPIESIDVNGVFRVKLKSMFLNLMLKGLSQYSTFLCFVNRIRSLAGEMKRSLCNPMLLNRSDSKVTQT